MEVAELGMFENNIEEYSLDSRISYILSCTGEEYLTERCQSLLVKHTTVLLRYAPTCFV